MSKLIVISALCLLAGPVFAAKVKVAIAGMTCQMCVKSITSELNATEKVKDVNVSLENKQATFETVGDKTITDAEIKAAVKKAGYEATSIGRN